MMAFGAVDIYKHTVPFFIKRLYILPEKMVADNQDQVWICASRRS